MSKKNHLAFNVKGILMGLYIILVASPLLFLNDCVLRIFKTQSIIRLGSLAFKDVLLDSIISTVDWFRKDVAIVNMGIKDALSCFDEMSKRYKAAKQYKAANVNT